MVESRDFVHLFIIFNDCHGFLIKCFNFSSPAGHPKTKYREKVMVCVKYNIFLAPQATTTEISNISMTNNQTYPEQVIVDVKYKHLMAPQATPKENYNI